MTTETAILAGGCFWCTEAVFKDVEGVLSVQSGYIGGHVENPSYRQVCEGTTGHAEAVKVEFDPSVISRAELFDIFFATHDPTQKDRQGHDVGPQYRSAIFFHDAAEKAEAEAAIARAQALWAAPIMTTLEPATRWWPAEDYHQDYFARVGTANPYCAVVIAPKLAKFRKGFAHRLKSAKAAAA